MLQFTSAQPSKLLRSVTAVRDLVICVDSNGVMTVYPATIRGKVAKGKGTSRGLVSQWWSPDRSAAAWCVVVQASLVAEQVEAIEDVVFVLAQGGNVYRAEVAADQLGKFRCVEKVFCVCVGSLYAPLPGGRTSPAAYSTLRSVCSRARRATR